MTAETLRAAFQSQARSCANLGSPFMARLCRLLAERLTPGAPLADRLFAWPGDISSAGASVPLRLCGALHALRLAGHPGLSAVYPPHEAEDDALWAAISAALTDDTAYIDDFINSAPQTNEVRRSAALIPAALWLNRVYPLPMVLSELGASAGLNLTFDSYQLKKFHWQRGPEEAEVAFDPEWHGPEPAEGWPTIAERRGVDLNPIDRATAADRLMAYLWPDQPARARLTRAALALPAPAVDRADAADWLEHRLAAARPGQLHLIYHTIAWQYFPAPVQERAAALIEGAGARATPDAPLAWYGMEADGADLPGARLTLRLWPGDLTLVMGRADFHGRWIDWRQD